MSRYQKDLGDFGERMAAEFLVRQGYEVLEHNLRVPGGELDLIVEKDTVLVFVEVKTRSNTHFGQPAEAVDRRKQEHMRRAAAYYLMLYPAEKETRFDVIEIFAAMQNGVPFLKELRHIPGIVLEG